MRLRILASFAVMVGACGGSVRPAPQMAPAPDEAAHAPGPDCKVVADHVAITIGEHERDQPEGDVSARAAYEKRCEADAWTDDARRCLAKAKSAPEIDGCMTMLTEPQRRALADDRAKLGKTAEPKPAATEAPHAKSHTRGPIKKDKSKGTTESSDPCEGGE